MAGRVFIGWSRAVLADISGLEVEAIALYETGQGALSRRELKKLGDALNSGGVIAKPPTSWAGEGLRLLAGVSGDIGPEAGACDQRDAPWR